MVTVQPERTMLEDIYQKDLLKLAGQAIGAGRLEHADAEASIDNPMCGDRIDVQIALDEKGHRISAFAYEIRACMLCQASASLLGRYLPGLSSDEVFAVEKELREYLENDKARLREDKTGIADFEKFAPVRQVKSRHNCVMLPFQAVREALAQARAF